MPEFLNNLFLQACPAETIPFSWYFKPLAEPYTVTFLSVPHRMTIWGIQFKETGYPLEFRATMFEALVKTLVYAMATYAFLGLLFALPFVWSGVQRLDSEAQGSGIGFRLLILPGVAAFWPMFLYRWRRGVVEPPVENNPHRLRNGA
ncbi:MAG: hypothetical protein ACRD72_20610 [Candidatus Angelobacter sp.]